MLCMTAASTGQSTNYLVIGIFEWHY